MGVRSEDLRTTRGILRRSVAGRFDVSPPISPVPRSLTSANATCPARLVQLGAERRFTQPTLTNMTIRLFVFTSILLSAVIALGQEAPSLSFTTIHGREYRNVALVRTVGRTIECMTPSGLQRVPIMHLPEEMRARYADVLAKHQPPKIGDSISFQCVNGGDFKNVTLVRVEPDGLSVATDAGIHKVRLDLMNEDFRQLFDFDEEAAAEYSRAQKMAVADAALRGARSQAATRETETRVAAEKELADRAQAESRAAAAATDAGPAPLGSTGTQRLGSPKLGGASR